MIATAIGKPRAKAPTIAHANAASEFTSGCALSSSDMAYSNRSGSVEAATGTKAATASPSRTLCPERTDECCSNMINGSTKCRRPVQTIRPFFHTPRLTI